MSAAKRKSDPASRRTVAANPEDAAVNQAAEGIAKRICSGRSAYVWCSEGPLVDKAMRRAGGLIGKCRFVEMGPVERSERATYGDSFCSELGHELYRKDQLKKSDLLKKLQKDAKTRTVISITHRMLAVQGAADFANWLGYFIEGLQKRNVLVIFGARESHDEIEKRLEGPIGRPHLPFKADQEIAIFNDEGRRTQSVGKHTASEEPIRATVTFNILSRSVKFADQVVKLSHTDFFYFLACVQCKNCDDDTGFFSNLRTELAKGKYEQAKWILKFVGSNVFALANNFSKCKNDFSKARERLRSKINGMEGYVPSNGVCRFDLLDSQVKGCDLLPEDARKLLKLK